MVMVVKREDQKLIQLKAVVCRREGEENKVAGSPSLENKEKQNIEEEDKNKNYYNLLGFCYTCIYFSKRLKLN
ncbi:hypothetical protein CEXT_646631 [Caerostris extrusa]|uniref:Uncharacterized protein n=1 Tax=Caerostris extrusa TaxID=172846 RepID=A0AAV4XKU7_CAEEX|nr:hypothetical protein CEXT_646631 [Caerostris extrusa]